MVQTVPPWPNYEIPSDLTTSQPFATVGPAGSTYPIADYPTPEAAVQAASDSFGSGGGNIIALQPIECTNATKDCGGGRFAAVKLGTFVNFSGTMNWANNAPTQYSWDAALNRNFLLATGTWSQIPQLNGNGRGYYTCPINGVDTVTPTGVNRQGSGLLVTSQRVNLGCIDLENFAEIGMSWDSATGPTMGVQAGQIRIKACGGTGAYIHAYGVDGEIGMLWVGACSRNIDILNPDISIAILHSWGAETYGLIFDGSNGSECRIAVAIVESNAGVAVYYNGASYVRMGVLDLWANGLNGVGGGLKLSGASFNSIGKCDAHDNIGTTLQIIGASHNNDINIDVRDTYAALDDSSALKTHSAAITAGQNTVHFADAPLLVGVTGAPSKHINCWLVIPGAGPAGAAITGARIVSIQGPSDCTISLNADTTVTTAAAVIHAVHDGIMEGTSSTVLDPLSAPNTYRGSCHLRQVLSSQITVNPGSQVLNMLGVNGAGIVVLGNSTAVALSARGGETTDATLVANSVPVTLFGASPLLYGQKLILWARQDTTGGRVLVWPVGNGTTIPTVLWSGGSMPSITTTASSITGYELRCVGNTAPGVWLARVL